MDDEYVEIYVNQGGEDIPVMVTLQTANILLNDSEAAQQYINEHTTVLNQSLDKQVTGKVDQSSFNTDNTGSSSTSTQALTDVDQRPFTTNDTRSSVTSTQALTTTNIVDQMQISTCPGFSGVTNNSPDNVISCPIWTSKRPTEIDIQATEVFLQLREKYSSKFDDKRCTKIMLWKTIAGEMTNMGYNLGPEKEAAEKLRLKFANMQKQYMLYIKHVNTTGEKYKEKPMYFDMMHSILKDKDKVNPKMLVDSIYEDSIEEKEKQAEEITNKSNQSEVNEQNMGGKKESGNSISNKDILNRFCKERTILKPKTTNDRLLEYLKKDSEERTEQFRTVQNLLVVQNEQRQQFLDQFKIVVAAITKNSKRKRNELSDDSDPSSD